MQTLVVIIIILIVIYVIWYLNLNILQISKYEIKSSKLPKDFDGFKIVHLSDMHLKEFGYKNTRLISKINKINPNVIVITGDMICKYNSNFEPVKNILSYLSVKYKIYYCLGNHEIEQTKEDLDAFLSLTKSLNVHVLSNKYEDLRLKESVIRIYGMDFKLKMDFKDVDLVENRKYLLDMQNTIGILDKTKFNILLSHDALNFKLYDNYGADLVFSGHVHGGAIRIFGHGLLSPRRSFFPKYSAGVIKGRNSKMIVSRGLGDNSLKLRLFNLPEIVTVVLKCDK